MTRTRRTTMPTVPLAERIRAALTQGWHTLAALDDLTGLRGSKARAAVHEALREIKASGATVEESMALGGVAARIAVTAADVLAELGTVVSGAEARAMLAEMRESHEEDAERRQCPSVWRGIRCEREEGHPCNDDGHHETKDRSIAIWTTDAADRWAAGEAERKAAAEPGPSSRCAVCNVQRSAHWTHLTPAVQPKGHPFAPKPRGRPRVKPIPGAAPAILPRAKQRKTPGPIVDVAAGRVERVGDAEPVREPWPSCVDCGEPDSGTCPEGRCRDCDLEHIFTTGACRECHTFLMREEMGAPPLAEQHVKGCTLATSDDWGVRNAHEYTVTRTARYGWAPEPKRGCEREFPVVRVWPIVIAAQRPAERCRPPVCHADSIHEPARVREFALPLCEAHRAWVEQAGGSVTT